MTFTMSVISGVIGGMVTATLLFFLTIYWRQVILPWFENLVYKGVHIDGVWRTEMTIDGQEKNEVVVIKQRAHTISGTITYPKDTQGYSHNYRLEGVFYDNVLTAITEEVGQARLDRGALVLTIQPGLYTGIMKGIGVWFEGPEPVAIPYKWVRESP